MNNYDNPLDFFILSIISKLVFRARRSVQFRFLLPPKTSRARFYYLDSLK